MMMRQTRITSGLVRSDRDRSFPNPVLRCQLARLRCDHPAWARVCLAAFAPSRRLRHILDADPDAAEPTPVTVHCRLPYGHAGPHLGPAVHSWRREHARWLRWGRWRYAVLDAAACNLGSADHLISLDEPDWCYLPRAHRGRHTFEYVPDAVWPLPVIHLADDYAGHGADRLAGVVGPPA